MTFSTYSLKSLSDRFFSFLEKLSQPNSKYITDKISYEITHRRNKALLMLELMFLFVFTLDFLLGKSPLSLYLVRLFSIVTVSSFLILSCFYHPQIFRIFYTTLCAAYGPIIINTSEQGTPKVWLTTFILPLCVYLFTGSAWHFLIQIIIQIYYANTIYRSLLEKTLEFSNITDLSLSLTHGMNTAIFLLTVFVVLNQYLMRSAYTRIVATEKKKDEYENQKTFLLGFSHELRNLINSLSGHVKLASLENLTERAKELLLNAEVCSELLHHLVNNILDTGKVEIGELEINPMPTRTYDAIERIWGISSELIRRKALRGSLKIKKNIPKTLMIDHYRLTQIFLNLVGNAVKFTEQGSIDITVSWNDQSEEVTDKSFQPYPFNETDEHDEGLFEKEQVFSSLDENLQVLSLLSRKVDKESLIQPVNRSQKGVLKVVISDTGCGMSKEETVKLFQKFTQVSSDASKRKLGTGLGLFITKQLCQRMSGDIKVFSKKDKGSSFIFCISAEVGPDENDHLKNMEATHKFLSSQRLKVMIVDDAPFSHTVLKRFFDKLGIEVVDIAVNGLEAYNKYLQLVESGNRPDIVTMDLDMPIMDGKEAAKKIRQLEQDRNLHPCFLPIISANCTESEITECVDKNGRIKADVFLKKPASMEELIRILGRHFVR